MKCPECGHKNPKDASACEGCGEKLGRAQRDDKPRSPLSRVVRLFINLAVSIAGVVLIGFLLYRAFFWLYPMWVDRLYETGYYRAAQVEEVTLDNMQVGHVVTFFGNDGDTIFLKEMHQSYMITGGVARVEIPDSSWFDLDPQQVEGVNITLAPVLTTTKNEKIPLPEIEFTVNTPVSPIELLNPTSPTETVLISRFPLSFRVVTGSTVIVGGKDLSYAVDEEGVVTASINVLPKGDNPVSILVKTPRHSEHRLDMNLFRAPQEISLEPDAETPKKTNRRNLKITGKTEPGAVISVESTYLADSLVVNMETGSFSFSTDFATIGEHSVSIRAKKDGKADSIISFKILYVPPRDEYINRAWAMAYQELRTRGDLSAGQPYLCKGDIMEIIPGTPDIIILNVGTPDDIKPVALANYSDYPDIRVGRNVRAYADVIERYFYQDAYIPYLALRYVMEGTNN